MILPELYTASPVAQLVKNPAANAGDTRDMGSISGSGRSPGEGNGDLCQYSCLENPTDGGVCRATVYGVAKSWTQLSMHTHKLFGAPQNLNLLLQWCLIYNSSKPKQSQSWYACVRACVRACSVAKSCLILLRPRGLKPARRLCAWNFPGKNTTVGCHFLLQG